jgi:hypothetical protein
VTELTDQISGQRTIGTIHFQAVAVGSERGVNAWMMDSLASQVILYFTEYIIPTPIVGNVLSLSVEAIQTIWRVSAGIQRTEVAVLVHDALGHLVEGLLGGGVQPFVQCANSVVLNSVII